MQLEDRRLDPGILIDRFLCDAHESVGFRHFTGAGVLASR